MDAVKLRAWRESRAKRFLFRVESQRSCAALARDLVRAARTLFAIKVRAISSPAHRVPH